MAEYITKDKAKELVCDFCQWAGTENCEECEHPVDDSPAADVVERKHGKWNNYKDEHCCSLCGAVSIMEDFNWQDCVYDFCPYCGAKMDGET